MSESLVPKHVTDNTAILLAASEAGAAEPMNFQPPGKVKVRVLLSPMIRIVIAFGAARFEVVKVMLPASVSDR
jgi:hypothetical protein